MPRGTSTYIPLSAHTTIYLSIYLSIYIFLSIYVDATNAFVSVISRRSAASGHDNPPQFDRIHLFKTATDRDDFVFGTRCFLMRVTRARCAKWPSVCSSAHPATCFASNPPVPLAIPSAGYLSRALDYVRRLLRVDSQLNAVYDE